MWRYLNKGISTPIAILIILVLAVVAGEVIWWQYSEIGKESSSVLEVRIPDKGTKFSKESTFIEQEHDNSSSGSEGVISNNDHQAASNSKRDSTSGSTQEFVLPKPQVHQRLKISFFRGVWAQPGGEERALENDIAEMKKDGVNIFPVSVLYHTLSDGTTKIVAISPEWESNPEQGYINLIEMAHNGGLAVFLEVDFDHWWQDQQFSDLSKTVREKFIDSSKSACYYWAQIGEKEQVELFSPINEPTNVLGKKEGIKWSEDVLPEIKKRFTGKTNIKIFGIELGDFSSFGTINGYDYVSVNVYAMDVSDSDFMSYITKQVMPYMNNLVRKYNLKGYLFGEMGVPANNKNQAQLFDQFFEKTWNDSNLKGYFLSGWGPKVALDDPFPDMRFTGYPAEDIIKNWYTKTR